jgi:Fe-S oxidoreductase
MPDALYLWVLTLISFGLFGRRAYRYVKVLLGARAEKRWDHPGQRLRLVLVNVLGQRRLLEEPVAGAAHFLIFWAFVFYASGFFWNLVRGLFPILPIPFADEVGWMRAALAVFGVLGLAALAVAAVRRYFFAPPRLEKSRDASIILALIAVVLISSLVGIWFHTSAPAVARAMWWVHMVTVLGFMAYLPYSKHMHLLASPFGVFFGSLQPGSVPSASEGAARRDEFTWRQLLSGLACAECGRCDRACPAFNSGFALSPKMLMHHMKELVRGDVPSGPGDGDGGGFIGSVVKPEEIWACTSCLACMTRCPVMNEHIPVLMEMRRRLVGEGNMDKSLQDALKNLTRYGNSFGMAPRARPKWTQQLQFSIKDARKEPVRYLWFVGDYASYDPRVAAATCASARVFRRAGLDFGILYEGEYNSGNDVRLAGEEGLFETLRDKNLASFAKAHFDEIVTTDPHSFQALKHEYPATNGARSVRHHTQLLSDLILSGELPLKKKLGMKVTYHDPCYLGRYNAVFNAPRRVMAALGLDLVEMPQNRTYAYCCGAGGGRIWMEDPPVIKERPAITRVREAASLKGVHTLVVVCPKDLVMFQDAIKTIGLEDQLEVKELSELVEQAMG